jgi:site-specific DNA-methyltransferase (adenine-specific)
MDLDVIYNMDCIEGMKLLPDKSIDMILCDLPYGTTGCKWDTVIPFNLLWESYNRIITDSGAIVLFGSEPFSTELRHSNLKMYKYDWVWNKAISGNPFLAKYQPLKIHENIMVFSKTTHKYYPQMRTGKLRKKGGGKSKLFNANLTETMNDKYYPVSILDFSNSKRKQLHPTQKPIDLCSYLIKTYTNEGEIVLDNCIGSGTTAIACLETGRHYIGYELDPDYYAIAQKRISDYEQEVIPCF